MSFFAGSARSRGGNVATMFALAMIPVVGAVGVAVDYSRVAAVRAELAEAVDAGVRALGSRPPMSDAEAFDAVNTWVTGHMAAGEASYWHLDAVTEDASGRIVASASANVETTVTRILGVATIPVHVTSAAMRAPSEVQPQ
jgi:Flp pilus assembly protein TadG